MSNETHQSPVGIFATTHWSVIIGAQQERSADTDVALEKLCSTYWRPVFIFVRRSTPDEHTAKDLTQAFFERFLEKDYIRNADQVRGRFRTFLLTCVKHFLSNQRDKEQAQRRGGGTSHLSFDLLIEDCCTEPESNPALTPDRSYERQWAHSVLDNVRSRLHSEYEQSSRTEVFDALKIYLSGDRGQTPYQEAAAGLSMSMDAVKKNVERMRHRFGKLLREEIAETVQHASEVEDELKFLRSALQN